MNVELGGRRYEVTVRNHDDDRQSRWLHLQGRCSNIDYGIRSIQHRTVVSSLFFGLPGSSNRVDWWMVGRHRPLQDTNTQVDQHFSLDHRRQQVFTKRSSTPLQFNLFSGVTGPPSFRNNASWDGGGSWYVDGVRWQHTDDQGCRSRIFVAFGS